MEHLYVILNLEKLPREHIHLIDWKLIHIINVIQRLRANTLFIVTTPTKTQYSTAYHNLKNLS